MAHDQQNNEPVPETDFAALFREADAIEEPGSDSWKNNGYPEDMGVAMDDADLAKHARRAGFVPPEERGDPPRQGPDTLPVYDSADVDAQAAAYGAEGDWGVPDADIDPAERKAQEKIDAMMASQAEHEMVDGNIEPPIRDEDDEDDEDEARTAATSAVDTVERGIEEAAADSQQDQSAVDAEQPGVQARQNTPGVPEGPMVPGGPVSALSGALVRGAGSLFRGGAYLAATGAATIGAAGLQSARGAKWGWKANQQRRSLAHRSQVERTLERASTVNEKFARGLGKLEGTEYQSMSSERAALMKKAAPTPDERAKITSLGDRLRAEADSNSAVRGALRDIKGAIRDGERVSRQMPAHVRKGAITEAEATDKLEAMRDPLSDHADEARGMVDENGKETGERARRMMEMFSEMLKKLFAMFSLRRQASDQGAEMAAG